MNIDDVIYSIQRTKNPKLKLFGNAAFGAIDLKGIKKLDNRTIRLKLSRADVTLQEAFAQYFQGVVPKGYQPNAVGKGPLQYIGTGPFKVKSFTPGRESVHERNRNYWRTGQPYFDQVRIINFPSDAAKVNALLSGQIEAMADVPFAQVPVVRRRNGLKISRHRREPGRRSACASTSRPSATSGCGERSASSSTGRRPCSKGCPASGGSPTTSTGRSIRRTRGTSSRSARYDPEQARSLLRQAGQENLSVELITSPADTGMVEGATIFAQNAKAGGVNVTVKNVDGGTIYGDQYLKWPFSADYWGTRNYLLQAATGVLKTAPFNETHWDAYSGLHRGSKSLYRQALATVDEKKRAEIIKEMQRMEYNDGGLIIWGFKNLTDGYSAKVSGYKVDRGTLNLNKYGNGFRTIYFV